MARRGFTLIEVLITIGILLLLSTLGIVNYRSAQLKGKEGAAQLHGGTVATTIANYLGTNLTVDPQDFMGSIVNTLPPADWSGAPPGTGGTRSSTDRSCVTGAVLPGGFSWSEAPRGTGCAFGVRNVGGFDRILVFTWVRGGTKYYVNGQSP